MKNTGRLKYLMTGKEHSRPGFWDLATGRYRLCCSHCHQYQYGHSGPQFLFVWVPVFKFRDSKENPVGPAVSFLVNILYMVRNAGRTERKQPPRACPRTGAIPREEEVMSKQEACKRGDNRSEQRRLETKEFSHVPRLLLKRNIGKALFHSGCLSGMSGEI